jgi:hypothetical protein
MSGGARQCVCAKAVERLRLGFLLCNRLSGMMETCFLEGKAVWKEFVTAIGTAREPFS